MPDITRFFDTIIRAPPWLFFAAVMVCGIPFLNIDILTRVGVRSDINIFGIPLWLLELISVSLFVSSATARYCKHVRDVISYIFDWLKWRIKLFALSDDARALLALVEEDALEAFYYDPRNQAISLLRDQDILWVELIASSGDRWGKFNLTYPYKKAYRRHRPMFRSVLKYSHEASAQVRATMQKARREATGRV